jgi:hypothetical protein
LIVLNIDCPLIFQYLFFFFFFFDGLEKRRIERRWLRAAELGRRGLGGDEGGVSRGIR